jgi:hypothetical protein
MGPKRRFPEEPSQRERQQDETSGNEKDSLQRERGCMNE